jgi:hypothetical protein
MAEAVAVESDLELAARLQRELNSLRGTRVRPASTANGVLGAPLGSCGATAALVARRATEQSSSSSESDDDDASTEADEEREQRRTEVSQAADAAAAARNERTAAQEEPGGGTTAAAGAAGAEGGGVQHVGGSGSGGGEGGGGGGAACSEGAAASDASGDRSDGAASARGWHGDEAHRNVAAAKATGGNVALARWKDAVAATSRKGESHVSLLMQASCQRVEWGG